MASTRHTLGRLISGSNKAPYICQSCRKTLTRPQAVTTQKRGYAANDNIPFTEKVRRKIWGTDNPPGLADPYGGPSFLERRRMEREGRQQNVGIDQKSLAARNKARELAEQEQELALMENATKAESAESYVPAETTDGLKEIGHAGSWRDIDPQPQDVYEPWIDSLSEPASDRAQLLSCLHQAIVECVTCQQAGIHTDNVFLFDSSEADRECYAAAKLHISESGTISHVEFASAGDEQQLVGLLSSRADTMEVDDTNEAEFDAEELQPLRSGSDASNEGVIHYTVSDETFLRSRLDLQNPLTFMILKRFSQLSGHRVPDNILSSITSSREPQTLSAFLDRFYTTTVKPAPKNLAEKLMSEPSLTAHGNVMVLPRRETPVDKEKEVGRWKIIERELTDRGLPVLGRLHG